MWNKRDDEPIRPITAPQAAMPLAATGERREPAVIGASISIVGDVTGGEDLTILGKVEGKIDLRIEEKDGFTIVDWKTDRIDQPAERSRREELYAPQLAAYERGLRAVLGPSVRLKTALLVFARERGS